MIKRMIIYFIKKYIARKKNIQLSRGTDISLNVLKKCGKGTTFLDNPICKGNITIGSYSSINGPATRISSEINEIIIGSYCSVASNVVIQEYYHKYERLSSFYIFKTFFGDKENKDIFSKGKIIIEDDVWIGSNSVILSGVIIGRGSVIGAGSIVTKNVPAYSIVVGNPARIIKKRFDEKTINLIESSQWWTWDESRIKQNKDIFALDNKDLCNILKDYK